MDDLALGFYGAIVFFSAFGFFLCAWWWFQIKHVTSMYVATTAFFISTTLYHSIDVYARWLSLTNTAEFEKFISSDMWAYRGALHLLVLFVFIMQLYVRMLKSYSSVKRLKKEIKYRRADDFPIR